MTEVADYISMRNFVSNVIGKAGILDWVKYSAHILYKLVSSAI